MSIYHNVKIKQKEVGRIDVFLDDKELKGVTHLELEADPLGIPQLTLQVNSADKIDVELAASVKIVAPLLWIPVWFSLPEEGQRILISILSDSVKYGKYEDKKFLWAAEECADYWEEVENVTAWIPIPDRYMGFDTEIDIGGEKG